MAKKISQLTQATEVKSDDVTVIVQDGETKKLPLNMMVTKQDIENKKIAGLAKLDEIEATYENDTYTPTITVKNKSSVKTGEGDEVDYSANVMDGHVKSAILSGSTKYRDVDTGEFLETFEEGRNLELVSVKMPVLTTTGKNLFGGELEIGSLNSTGIPVNDDSRKRSKDFFPFNGDIAYIITNAEQLYFYDENKNFISRSANKADVSPTNTCFIKVRTTGSTEVQIEKGAESTSYEPFKSNILTTPEDLELRGIGDVKDTLDLTTGELTERIGEIVLDGSEGWTRTTSSTDIRGAIYGISISDIDATVKNDFINCICDRAMVERWTTIINTMSDKTFAVLNNQQIRVQFNGTLEELKTWLSEVQPTVQYLKTESIKTVDLMPSGTHPSTTPYCWKNGHIQLSSSGLLPNLEYSVVTSRAGQINQNATMIVKNDKRIFDLEILLAGGLVNTTYQALTLQNQVETGLSKVSLNSETEPDYLLYHMIMKLIEEKAYKLDDLTEKVSVFYLYEKLSDEQFETIYSALYPFVEDEIVEEPVVEELPEVVEDEVIM